MDVILSGITTLVQYYIPRIFGLTTVIFVLPSCFSIETGFRRYYLSILHKLFDWASHTLEKKEIWDKGRRSSSGPDELIVKENSITRLKSFKDLAEKKQKFQLEDVSYLIKSGIEAVIDDEVTKRFRSEELSSSWNLLTRTNYDNSFVSFHRIRLSILWLIGLLFRYFILFPIRVCITLTGMTWMLIVMVPLSMMSNSKLKRRIVYFANVFSFRICCRAFTGVVNYHDRENMPMSGSICVANHTTTLDVCLLVQDRPYSVLGQIHGGFLGWFEKTLSKCSNHVWFERSEIRHRKFVVQRLQEHLGNPDNFPVLLFPEGTCINNTCVMMFKKGTFEIPVKITPVAIKYNPLFGDAFWNSSTHSMIQYLFVVMTSWAIVADVWYLPSMERGPDEEAVHFANRVRSVIARKGGLVDCFWDGQLKRSYIKDSYKQEKQREISEIILRGYDFSTLKIATEETAQDEEPEMNGSVEDLPVDFVVKNVDEPKVEDLETKKIETVRNGLIPDSFCENINSNSIIDSTQVRKI